MRRFAAWVVLRIAVIGILAAAASGAHAQGTVLTVTGPVVAVDKQQSTIHVQDQDQGKTFVIQIPSDSAKLLVRNGQQIALQDLQVGQTVQIRHEQSGGKYIVQQIEVLPAATTTPVITPAVTQIQTPAAVVAPMPVVVEERWSPFDKLARGLGNGLFGFLEIPRQIFNTSSEDSLLAGLTVGAFKGIGYSIARMGTGAYEIVTFPIPVPENYRPLIEPKYPWEAVGPTYFG